MLSRCSLFHFSQLLIQKTRHFPRVQTILTSYVYDALFHHSNGRFTSADGLRCSFQRGIRHLRRICAVSQRCRGPVAYMRFTRSCTQYLRSTQRTQRLWRNHRGCCCPRNIRRNWISLQAATVQCPVIPPSLTSYSKIWRSF